MNDPATSQPPNDFADALSREPIGDASGSPTPKPGLSGSAPRSYRKRERAWLIMLMLVLGILVIEVYDHFIGIPNQ